MITVWTQAVLMNSEILHDYMSLQCNQYAGTQIHALKSVDTWKTWCLKIGNVVFLVLTHMQGFPFIIVLSVTSQVFHGDRLIRQQS